MPVTPPLRSRAGSEPIRFAQGKLREGSGSTGAEILRFAQDDSQDTAQARSGKPYLQMSAGALRSCMTKKAMI